MYDDNQLMTVALFIHDDNSDDHDYSSNDHETEALFLTTIAMIMITVVMIMVTVAMIMVTVVMIMMIVAMKTMIATPTYIAVADDNKYDTFQYKNWDIHDDEDDDATPPSECPLIFPVKTITQMAFSCRPIT